MKQLATDYELGKWNPLSEVGGKVGVDTLEVEDTRDNGIHAITSSKEMNSQQRHVKKPSTKKGKDL